MGPLFCLYLKPGALYWANDAHPLVRSNGLLWHSSRHANSSAIVRFVCFMPIKYKHAPTQMPKERRSNFLATSCQKSRAVPFPTQRRRLLCLANTRYLAIACATFLRGSLLLTNRATKLQICPILQRSAIGTKRAKKAARARCFQPWSKLQ